jgi:hypothetical protein
MTVGASDRAPGDAGTRGFPFIKAHSSSYLSAPLPSRPLSCWCRRRPQLGDQHQDLLEHRHLSHLEHHVAAVADHLGADLDQQFFARREPDKLALKIGKYNIGYLPFSGQVVRHSPVNRNTRPNFSKSFYITRDRAPDHPDIVNEKPLVGLNRWPPDMPEFRT